MPRGILKIGALFVPFLREIDEMMYQWERPFMINDARFRARFRQQPEDVEKAAADTVAWAKAHYAPQHIEYIPPFPAALSMPADRATVVGYSALGV